MSDAHRQAFCWFDARLKQTAYVRRLLREYELIILRYPFWDPILWVSYPGKRRTILEHHTTEVPELKIIRNRVRASLEGFFGSRWLRGFRALIGVTPELIDYEVGRSGFRGPTAVFPNTIRVLTCPEPCGCITEGNPTSLKAVMAASYFFKWHGVERIIDQLTSGRVELHLVGELSNEQHLLASNNRQVVVHGCVDSDRLREIYADVHVGLGSFALSLKDMAEASTLKVREYLASGLPVVIGHKDPTFSLDFPFVKQVSEEGFSEELITDFVGAIAHTPRSRVRALAKPLIDTDEDLHRLYGFCLELLS